MKISIADPSATFTEHLNQPLNSRIVFSGKFGIGKSHFLREYFTENAENFNLFSISPIHYVVGANQDIFEWIKIDLAKQLLKRLPEEESQTIQNLFIPILYLSKRTRYLSPFINLCRRPADQGTNRNSPCRSPEERHRKAGNLQTKIGI